MYATRASRVQHTAYTTKSFSVRNSRAGSNSVQQFLPSGDGRRQSAGGLRPTRGGVPHDSAARRIGPQRAERADQRRSVTLGNGDAESFLLDREGQFTLQRTDVHQRPGHGGDSIQLARVNQAFAPRAQRDQMHIGGRQTDFRQAAPVAGPAGISRW